MACVIFNNLGSTHQRRLIETGTRGKVYGWISRDPGLTIESRHFGLHMGDEMADNDPLQVNRGECM